MNAAVAHGLATAYMGAAETAAGLQKHLDTQKYHATGDNSKRK